MHLVKPVGAESICPHCKAGLTPALLVVASNSHDTWGAAGFADATAVDKMIYICSLSKATKIEEQVPVVVKCGDLSCVLQACLHAGVVLGKAY